MEARICDVCEKTKAENICVLCGRDTCKRCKRAPILKIENNIGPYTYSNKDIFKMCTFNFCLPCYKKIPWGNKETIEDENLNKLIIEQLKKRILAEEMVKRNEEKIIK